ncbi:hypothetical protein NSMM_80003 [Nitrosomonas mobilis]|uniref:Uncharacterized protein n=1 Tax=Nitrosomonas mobilis TaxID=51642 RepID=A0A1G5SHU0_9PROT|nr:hypothetical protein NSMM_80003 [Nitrosomonas mobilis]
MAIAARVWQPNFVLTRITSNQHLGRDIISAAHKRTQSR